MWSPRETGGSGRFLTGRDIPVTREVTKTALGELVRTTLETPRGALTMTTRVDTAVNTTWTTEHLLKDVGDIDRFLSVPWEPYRPDLSGFADVRDKLGDRGVILPHLSDPIDCVGGAFEFADFMVLCFTEKKRIRYFLDAMLERVMDYLEYQLAGGVTGLFRICGPELATAPYLPREYFREFAADYDKKLVEMIHSYGAKARLHCHGRIAEILDDILDIGVDALDPVEDFPSGNIALRDVKARIGGEIALFGNIQLQDLEALGEAEMVALTRRTLEAGMDGGGFALMPTASPISARLSPITERNYHAMVDTALRYGKY